MQDENLTGASSDERLWALLAHLSYFVVAAIGPLVIYLLKKDESEFIEDQAKEALNFQLSVIISAAVCGLTICLIPVAVLIAIGAVVFAIMAAVESQKGVRYRYPYTFRLIK